MLENNLSASELLTAFIDGELEATDTQMLFYQLANDAELQSEMQDLIAIRTGFSNSSVLPPPDLRNAILKNTVYQKGIAGKFALIPAFLGKYAFRIAASVASLILIGLFSFWLVNYDNNSEAEFVHNSNSESVISGKSIKPVEMKNNSETHHSENSIVNNSQFSVPENIDRKYDNYSTSTYDKDVKENPTNQISKQTKNKSDNYGIIDFADNFSLSVMPPEKNIDRKDYINFYNLSSRFNKFLENVSISLNKQALFSNPNPKIINQNKPMLNDFSLNINYSINPNHYLGIEFGREFFPMQFKGTELINNREVEYEYPLSYNALWAGISYTYNFENTFSKRFVPYSKLTAGGTSLGPVAKLSLGTNYFLNDNIGIYAGIKYGALFYSYQSNVFITSKYGIDYGLMIKL